MFADDIVLLTDSEKGLQESRLKDFCSDWDLSNTENKVAIFKLNKKINV